MAYTGKFLLCVLAMSSAAQLSLEIGHNIWGFSSLRLDVAVCLNHLCFRETLALRAKLSMEYHIHII
jgi:hypothetical protein